jgi:hypothetical protein
VVAAQAASAAQTPLSALIWVFGVAGGLVLALMLLTGALAYRNKGRRSEFSAHIGKIGDVWDWGRVISVGDLVMDSGLRRELEQKFRPATKPSDPGPHPGPGDAQAL